MMTDDEIRQYVARHGCFCGGHGKYDDYNCGVSFEVTCPHCRGTGRKVCACVRPELSCPHGVMGEVVR